MTKKPQPQTKRPEANKPVALDDALRRILAAPPQHKAARKKAATTKKSAK